MSQDVVVVGAGGFGREVLDVLEAVNASSAHPPFRVLGVLDDDPSEVSCRRLAARGVPLLGSVGDWVARGRGGGFVVGIGRPQSRRAVAARLKHAGLEPVTVVHPSAVVGSQVTVGAGTVVCAGVNVSTNVTLGDHVHLNPGAVIGHDTELADFVSVNPGAIVSGECRVEPEALVGAGAVVLQGLTVGAASVVGAAACVVTDVPTESVVRGVPAR